MNRNAETYFEKTGIPDTLSETDPEFADFFGNFIFDEVVNEEGKTLDDETRYMCILAVLIGCQGYDVFRDMVGAALYFGVSPIVIKEVIYQATAYCGIGRVYPALKAANEVFKERNIAMPLEGQSTTNPENRREMGTAKQMELFGPQMENFWKNGNINRWLAANCFGDYYTRTPLNNAQREMITFCYLAGQGGCEPQLTSHAAANMMNGNSYDFLMCVISQIMPYIGYPRTLNAISCLNKAAQPKE